MLLEDGSSVTNCLLEGAVRLAAGSVIQHCHLQVCGTWSLMLMEGLNAALWLLLGMLLASSLLSVLEHRFLGTGVLLAAACLLAWL